MAELYCSIASLLSHHAPNLERHSPMSPETPPWGAMRDPWHATELTASRRFWMTGLRYKMVLHTECYCTPTSLLLSTYLHVESAAVG